MKTISTKHCHTKLHWILNKLTNSSKIQPLYSLFLLTFRQPLLPSSEWLSTRWWTVSNHRCVKVGRTPCLGSSTCLVLFWCVSLPWSIGPSYCFLCRSHWCGPSLGRGSKRWRGLWLPTCFALLLRIYWCFVCKPLHHVVKLTVDVPVAVPQKLYLFTQCDVRAYTQSTGKSAATEQNKSAVTDHSISLNHVIEWDHAKVIDRESNRRDTRQQRLPKRQKNNEYKDCILMNLSTYQVVFQPMSLFKNSPLNTIFVAKKSHIFNCVLTYVNKPPNAMTSLIVNRMAGHMRVIPKVSGLDILDNNIFHNLYISETHILYEL